MRRHLTTTGKGRPPKLPTSPESDNPTNLQLVQIYSIKKEAKLPWTKISVAMEKMFQFPEARFRVHIESAVKKMETLELEDMKMQLNSTVDLKYVGPFCSTLHY